MGEALAAAMPTIISSAAMGGMQGAMSLFGGSDIEDISGYAREEGDLLDPRLRAAQFLQDIGQMGVQRAGLAAQPVTMPGSFIQPPGPYYTGGGLPMPIGVTAQDPALFDPMTYQARAGLQFAQPHYPDLKAWGGGAGEGQYEGQPIGPDPNAARHEVGAESKAPKTVQRWMFGEYAPRMDPNVGIMQRGTPAAWGATQQPDAAANVDVGGGIPALKANLELLGVTTNPATGTFESAATANPQLYQGGQPENVRGGVAPSAVPFGGGPGLTATYAPAPEGQSWLQQQRSRGAGVRRPTSTAYTESRGE